MNGPYSLETISHFTDELSVLIGASRQWDNYEEWESGVEQAGELRRRAENRLEDLDDLPVFPLVVASVISFSCLLIIEAPPGLLSFFVVTAITLARLTDWANEVRRDKRAILYDFLRYLTACENIFIQTAHCLKGKEQ